MTDKKESAQGVLPITLNNLENEKNKTPIVRPNKLECSVCSEQQPVRGNH